MVDVAAGPQCPDCRETLGTDAEHGYFCPECGQDWCDEDLPDGTELVDRWDDSITYREGGP